MPEANHSQEPAQGVRTLRRALLSVSDKAGLPALARTLNDHGVELLSTGGTARLLADEGLPVTPVEDVTGFPEMLGGRVKTLHPRIHGGILGNEAQRDHADAMKEHGIRPIDLVVVNLYPFEQAAADPNATDDQLIEQIDIGGPAMIRSAAKNHARVAVVVAPEQYQRVTDELAQHGGTTHALRRALAIEAFRHTSAYDAAIAKRLGSPALPDASDELPARLDLSLERVNPLRYGENPHQRAASYRDANAPLTGGRSVIDGEVLAGKALSFNNIADAAAATGLANELARVLELAGRNGAAAVVVKHTNPCGAATGPSARDAVDGALVGDPLAAYGGILALAGVLDREAAERIATQGVFLEVVCAHAVDGDALGVLRDKSSAMRVIALGAPDATGDGGLSVRSIGAGGYLVQDADTALAEADAWQHAAGPVVDAERLRDAAVVWTITKHLSSNAIAIGGRDADRTDVVRLFGAGAGQMDRVAACRIAVNKAGDRALGAIAASDAFFPFSDGPGVLMDAGVDLILHPGGSKRDADTFDACNARNRSCYTTGRRHFRH